jgi:hypothetical protein
MKPGSHTKTFCVATVSSERRSPGSSSALRRPPVLLGWPTAKPGARGGVRGRQSCLRHRGLTRFAWRNHLKVRGAARGDATAHIVPCTRHARHEGRQTHRLITQRRRARGHDEPRSSDPSRGGRTAARRPAHRQGKGIGGAPRRRRPSTGKQTRREGRRRWL